MPIPLANPEAVARAILKPKEKSVTPQGKAASQIREVLNKDGPRKATEFIAARKENKPFDANERERARILNENIGAKRKADGTKDRNAEEAERFTKAKDYEEATVKLLKTKEWTKLTPEQRKHVVIQFEDALKDWPEGKRIFDDLPKGKAREEFVRDLVLQKGFLDKLSASREVVMKSRVDIVTAKRQEFEEAEKVEEAKARDVELKEEARTKFKNEWGPTGGKKTALDTLRGRKTGGEFDLPAMTTLREEVSVLVQDEWDYRKRVGAERDPVRQADLRRDLDAIRARIVPKKTELGEKEGAIKTLAALEEENSKYDTELLRMDQEMLTHTAERLRLTTDKLTKKASLEQAEIEWEEGEEKFVEGLENLVRNATLDFFEEEAQKAEEAQGQLVNKYKEEVKTEAGKLLADAAKKRWTEMKTVGFFRRRVKKVPLAGVVDADMYKLLSGGPKDVIKNILSPLKLSPEEADETVKTLLEADGSIEKIILDSLLKQRVALGSLPEEEAQRIADSQWGKKYLGGAVEGNEGVKGALAKLKEEQLLTDASLEGVVEAGRGMGMLIKLLFAAGLSSAAIETAMRSKLKTSFF